MIFLKLCVFSDSHGYGGAMLHAIEENEPDMIIHLGDGGAELNKIRSQFPQIPLKAVRGNCDLSLSLPDKEIIDVNGLKIFLTHGHLYGVKNGLDPLLDAARLAQAGLVLYGHTHTAHYTRSGGIEVLNPGSCGLGSSRSFALINIGAGGSILCRIVPL